MSNLLVLAVMQILVYSKTCSELSPRIINTYIVSDSYVLYKEGLNLKPSIEVSNSAWYTIPNTSWIWNTADYYILDRTIVEFSKSFFVPGRIINGVMDYLVDNNLNELKVNGQLAQLSNSGTFDIRNQVNITSLLVYGINNFSATVENIQADYYNPGGFCFLMNITSEILV